MGSVKFPHLKIGPDIDLVCSTSSFFTNIVMTSDWMRAIRQLDDPVASSQAEPSCCQPGFLLVDYLGIHP